MPILLFYLILALAALVVVLYVLNRRDRRS